MLLEIKDLWVSYDHIQAVRGVTLNVAQGEIVTLIGANGAGKSSILRAISGLQPLAKGVIYFDGQDLRHWSAHLIAQQGIAHVPEGRGIFGTLTVLENLRLAAYGRKDDQIGNGLDSGSDLFPRLAERRSQWGSTLFGGERQMSALGRALRGWGIFGTLTVLENLRLAAFGSKDDQLSNDLERVFSLFPRLAERRSQWGSTLSGGEQQMLALGRALMRRGRLLLLDEPSMGLAPFLVKEIFKIIKEINRQGATVLLVEQNAHMALKIAHRGYVLETGEIILSGQSADLLGNPVIQKAYLGR